MAGIPLLEEPWQSSYAILIKTGSVAAQERVPIQMLTWAKHVKQLLLIGDQPGMEPVTS